MWAVVGMTMTGCVKTEVEGAASDAQSGKIGFATLVNKGSRVALDNNSIQKFWVYGGYTKNSSQLIQIFNSEEVTKGAEIIDGNQSVWTYAGDPRYWIEGASYTFYAYSNGNQALTPEAGRANYADGVLNIADYLADGAHQEDLVFASKSATGKAQGANGVVGFEFKHLLSRLRFNFTYAFPEGYEVTISKARISNIRNKGKYNSGTNPGWDEPSRQPATPAPAISMTFDNAQTAVISTTDKEARSQNMYVIPFKYESANVDLLFTIDVTYDGTAILSREVKGQWAPQWEMGKSYAYNVNISGTSAGLEKIEFSADKVGEGDGDGWASGEDNANFEFESTIPTPGN